MNATNPQLLEKEWIRQFREAALQEDLKRMRALLLTEYAQKRFEGFNLQPENDVHLRLIMRSTRKHLQEGEAFRRGILSEGRPPNQLEEIALQLGLTPDIAVLGAFAQERGSGKGSEKEK